MAEQNYQSLPINISQSDVKEEHTSPSLNCAPSPSSGETSTTSNLSRRRKQTSMSPNNQTTAGSTKEPTRQRQKAKTISAKGRTDTSRGSLMTMPGLLDPAGEITYTPTTHRISKAKKGKKVHACEYPGCPKIFTRAEHRKRHEANHNTSPAFKCEIDGCRKPFQRADLLARHMERQHNMPSAEASAFRSQYRRDSASGTSSPSRGSLSAPPPPQQGPVAASSLPQVSSAMSIGSIIEPNMHRSSYASHAGANLNDEQSHVPIGTAPRSLLPELLYGLSPSGDSPLYSSSDSCYSPLSDYLQQPQAGPQQYYPQEVVQRSQSTSIDPYFQPIIQTPLSAETAPPTWNGYDPNGIEFAPEASCLPQQRQYIYHSPSWPGARPIPPYETQMHLQQPWPWTKVSY